MKGAIHDSKYSTTCVLFASTYTAKQLKTIYYSLINNALRLCLDKWTLGVIPGKNTRARGVENEGINGRFLASTSV